MLIGTIDHWPVLVALTFAVGHEVSGKRNIWGTFHPHLASDQDEIGCAAEAVQTEHHDTTSE